MSQYNITINQSFTAPVETVFAKLGDHEQLGDILGGKIVRTKEGSDSINGLGSVREIKLGPVTLVEETVTGFEPNAEIEYKITSNSPVKNHIGRMTFSGNGNSSELHYTIDFDFGLPIGGGVVKFALENTIKRGLKKYAKSLRG